MQYVHRCSPRVRRYLMLGRVFVAVSGPINMYIGEFADGIPYLVSVPFRPVIGARCKSPHRLERMRSLDFGAAG